MLFSKDFSGFVTETGRREAPIYSRETIISPVWRPMAPAQQLKTELWQQTWNSNGVRGAYQSARPRRPGTPPLQPSNTPFPLPWNPAPVVSRNWTQRSHRERFFHLFFVNLPIRGSYWPLYI